MRDKRQRRIELVSRALFLVYVVVLIYFLLFSSGMGRTLVSEDYRYNLTLFKEIHRFWSKRETVGLLRMLLNIGGNVLCFVPFGFFLPDVSRYCKSPSVVIPAGFTASLAVETIQLELKIGSFDVDDLLLNTLGVILGYLAGWIWRLIRRRLYEKKEI